jgi:nucleotide-binding universal stress UspA family protein
MKGGVVKHIVVGVDGSSSSKEAARWAVEQARETGAELEVVHAWSAPEMGTDRIAAALAAPDCLEQAARRELREILDRLDDRGLVAPITARVVCAEAATALLEACREGDLLVVGRRGLSGGDDGHFGTVTRRLIHEASCPVVVVPG